ncbi:Ubiquinone/menaquinone biosynthesis C-methylase UbiE [Promicromonospora umidemergens]|uniref:Methyltransferase type 11 domain-containing protein n=1 Tax=Promicromonospora umidemergens TaxID=629679 RepID=A0ABP8XLZ4_9MICO|nr:class I SAM-dependent methyltransferase [Promicromonospora umidemergens]MCP2281992.1 Ubiquinone/menaquinone biosynthesis C-methylase UbiE [Promicromonospora umidemergens]
MAHRGQDDDDRTGQQSGGPAADHRTTGHRTTDQRTVDLRVQEYYAGRTGWDEHARLTTRTAQGPVEHIRTQELVRQRLAPGARVLDVGGATGVHAAPLAADGYDVLLVDPVAGQVARATEHGTFDARVGDARDLAGAGLELADGTFDAVLLLGPLYHLATREDRLLALREAVRVTRPGGTVVAAAITRLAALVGGGYELFGPPAWQAVLEHGVAPDGIAFPAAHFHDAAELAAEATDAGLSDVVVHGIEGPAGGALERVALDDPEAPGLIDAALTLARSLSTVPGVPDMSQHILAIGTVSP